MEVLYPELMEMGLGGLRAAFDGPPPDEEVCSGRDRYAGGFYEETAWRIREVGRGKGVAYLLAGADEVDAPRLEAILVALTRKPVIRTSEVEALLHGSLGHEDPHVVAQAIEGLSYLGALDAREEVLRRRSHDDGCVRCAVLRYLRRLTGTRALPFLERALTDPDPAVRWCAVEEFAELDPVQVVPTLERLADDSDEEVRVVIDSALRLLGRGTTV